MKFEAPKEFELPKASIKSPDKGVEGGKKDKRHEKIVEDLYDKYVREYRGRSTKEVQELLEKLSSLASLKKHRREADKWQPSGEHYLLRDNPYLANEVPSVLLMKLVDRLKERFMSRDEAQIEAEKVEIREERQKATDLMEIGYDLKAAREGRFNPEGGYGHSEADGLTYEESIRRKVEEYEGIANGIENKRYYPSRFRTPAGFRILAQMLKEELNKAEQAKAA